MQNMLKKLIAEGIYHILECEVTAAIRKQRITNDCLQLSQQISTTVSTAQLPCL